MDSRFVSSSGKFLDAADREAVAANVVVLRVHATRVEVQAIGVRRAVRRSRPVITVVPLVVHGPGCVVAVARSGIRSNHLLNAVRDPRGKTPPQIGFSLLTATRPGIPIPATTVLHRQWVTEFTRHAPRGLDLAGLRSCLLEIKRTFFVRAALLWLLNRLVAVLADIILPGCELFGYGLDLFRELRIQPDVDMAQIVEQTQAHFYTHDQISRPFDVREFVGSRVGLVDQYDDFCKFVLRVSTSVNRTSRGTFPVFSYTLCNRS